MLLDAQDEEYGDEKRIVAIERGRGFLIVDCIEFEIYNHVLNQHGFNVTNNIAFGVKLEWKSYFIT